MRPVVPSVTGEHGISRFSREVFLCMQRVFGRAGFPYLSPWRGVGYGLPLTGTSNSNFESQDVSRLGLSMEAGLESSLDSSSSPLIMKVIK
jgi:hypothetical protein